MACLRRKACDSLCEQAAPVLQSAVGRFSVDDDGLERDGRNSREIAMGL